MPIIFLLASSSLWEMYERSIVPCLGCVYLSIHVIFLVSGFRNNLLHTYFSAVNTFIQYSEQIVLLIHLNNISLFKKRIHDVELHCWSLLKRRLNRTRSRSQCHLGRDLIRQSHYYIRQKIKIALLKLTSI